MRRGARLVDVEQAPQVAALAGLLAQLFYEALLGALRDLLRVGKAPAAPPVRAPHLRRARARASAAARSAPRCRAQSRAGQWQAGRPPVLISCPTACAPVTQAAPAARTARCPATAPRASEPTSADTGAPGERQAAARGRSL